MLVRCLAVLLLVGFTGCAEEGSADKATAVPAPSPVQSKDQPQSVPLAIGLTPLPTAQEVQDAAPGGRNDPFAPLRRPQDNPGAGSTQDSGFSVTLTGVLTVGHQHRALVSTAQGSGVICVGSNGRCGDDAPVLLPTGWSVLSIDVERGCISLALNGKAQGPVCIA